MTKEKQSKINEIIESNTVADLTIAYYCLINEGLSESQAVHYIIMFCPFLISTHKNTRHSNDIADRHTEHSERYEGFGDSIVQFIRSTNTAHEEHRRESIFGHLNIHIYFYYTHRHNKYEIEIKSYT